MEDTTTAIAAAPGQVGARLKQLRARRSVTVTRTPGGVQVWKVDVPDVRAQGEGAPARARTVGEKASAE